MVVVEAKSGATFYLRPDAVRPKTPRTPRFEASGGGGSAPPEVKHDGTAMHTV